MFINVDFEYNTESPLFLCIHWLWQCIVFPRHASMLSWSDLSCYWLIFVRSSSVPSSPTSSTSSGPPSPGRSDSLSQLSALVRRGEKRGIFSDNIPPSIRRLVIIILMNYLHSVLSIVYLHFYEISFLFIQNLRPLFNELLILLYVPHL